MIGFLSNLFVGNKHHHLAWMRANPVHQGHVEVARAVTKGAQGKHTYSIILSNAHDSSKNPLPQSKKLTYAKKAFSGRGVSLAEPKTNILNYAAKLYNQGYTHLHVYAGTDRIVHFKNLLNKYNGKGNTHGFYKFKKIYIHKVGGCRESFIGVNSYSGTKMREAAKLNKTLAFSQMAPESMKISDVIEMFNDVRVGMKLPID